jgi:hypothetical protein
MAKGASTEVLVKVTGRLLSSALYKRGKPYQGKGEGNYYVHVGVPKSDEAGSQYKAIWDAVMKSATLAYGKDAKARIQGVKDKDGAIVEPGLMMDKGFVFRNGNRRKREDGTTNEFYKDLFYIVGSSKVQPLLLNGAKEEIDESSGLLYNGCIVRANIAVYANDNGVFGQVQGVLHLRDGERIGGGGRIAKKDEFDDVSDPDAATGGDDLTGGFDDDIPF